MTVELMRDLAINYAELNANRVTRPELGELGLPKLAEVIEQFRRETQIIAAIATYASEGQINQAKGAYSEYLNVLYSLSSADQQSYATDRSHFGEQLRQGWDHTRDIWPIFAAIAADRETLARPLSAYLDNLKSASDRAIREIEELAVSSLADAKSEAAQIIENARATVRGFSVKDAQTQFNEASVALQRKAIAWGAIGAGAFVWFLTFAFRIYRQTSDQFIHTTKVLPIPELVYLGAVRLTILTAIGALATFCLKMLRAHLHMSETNNHRRRVANSMAAFVESANTREQQDEIFMKLVEAVVAFGDSGLLNKDSEGLSVPSIAIDAITKNLSVK